MTGEFHIILVTTGWLCHFKLRGFVARSVAARPHALKLARPLLRNYEWSTCSKSTLFYTHRFTGDV